MNKNLDELLYQTLNADAHEPSPALNRRILEKAEKQSSESEVLSMKKEALSKKEMLPAKKQAFRRIPKTAAAAIAACVILAGGGTAYAAHRYLSASEISDAVSDNQRLSKAFESKDAIFINETQASGDYVFTLLGLVSGSDLEPYVPEETADNLSKQRTYAAVAIAKANGSAMSKNSSASPIGDVSYQSAGNGTADTALSQAESSDMPEHSFCVSPLIGGVSFQTANNGTMNTSLHWFVQDHVTYELMACDDLEIFADRGVWLSIVKSFGQEAHAFSMDAASGAYTKNESYDDFSALFRLPLDEKKADAAAADAYLKALEAGSEAKSDDAADEDSDTPAWITEFVAGLTEDNIRTRCTLQPEYTLTATPDANGWIDFGSVYIASEGMTYDGSAGQIAYLINDDQDFIVTGYSYSDSPETDLTIQTLKRNADGSFTSEQYRISEHS